MNLENRTAKRQHKLFERLGAKTNLGEGRRKAIRATLLISIAQIKRLVRSSERRDASRI